MNMRVGNIRIALALLAALSVDGLAHAAGPEGWVALRGAGATFPAPLYYKWMEAYGKAHPGINITYDAVGSGDGVGRFMAGSIDFGASDAAPSDQEMGKVGRGAVLVPATAGMI